MKRKLAVNHPIYQHFTSDELNKFHNCNHCSKSYSMATSSNSLTSLKYHLNTKHADKVQSSPIEMTPFVPASKLKQRTLFATKASKKTVEQRYAELVCLDGMSFKAVAESSFIRETMPLLGYKGYTSADTVKAKIISFYKQARATTVTDIEAAKKEGQKFSITFDEYTGMLIHPNFNFKIHLFKAFLNTCSTIKIYTL